MTKYINADLLKENLDSFFDMTPSYTADYDCGYDDCLTAVQDTISDMPAADVKEVVHGEWIEKEHWIPLPRDYEVSYDSDYDDCYDEKTHSWKEKYWHCSRCSYEASRSMKPWFDYCPKCGVKMKK